MEKPAMNQFFDRCIQNALQSKANETAPSGVLLDKIRAEINDKERENFSMNNISNIRRVKPVVIVALVLILSVATVFAASQVTSLVSTSTDTFDKFPTAKQVEKAVNYVPDYVENFSNGFYFKNASINNTAALDADDNKVNESKGINFFYTRDNAQKNQMLTLNTNFEGPGMTGGLGQNEEVIKEADLDLIYSQVTLKVVPESYTPTEEENKLMEQGKLWVSSGADEIETSNLQYVRWTRDGIIYNLTDNGYNLEKDEILGMAKEVLKEAE